MMSMISIITTDMLSFSFLEHIYVLYGYKSMKTYVLMRLVVVVIPFYFQEADETGTALETGKFVL